LAAPHWNYGYMMASVALSIVPCVAMMVGIFVAVRSAWFENKLVWLITLATIGVYALALVHHALTLPYYCAIKAFYTIGATPAYALLAVAGFDLTTKSPVTRSLVYGLFACWAVSVYVTYLAQK
jgi:hypothetical protein